MKRILLIVVIALIITGFLYYYFTRDQKEGNDFIKVSGNIETTEVNVGFKIPGRIVSLSAQEGDWVDYGKIIAKLDDEDLRHRFELARAILNSAQAKLNKLLAGSRPGEIREAEAVLFQAKSDLENKQAHYERMKPLFGRGIIPKETLDNAEAGYKIARASFQKATENYLLTNESSF